MPSTPLRITPLGSLKEIENLKHLRICRRSLSSCLQPEPLILSEILPSSLEVLVIHKFRQNILSLEDLTHDTSKGSNLRFVRVSHLKADFLGELLLGLGASNALIVLVGILS